MRRCKRREQGHISEGWTGNWQLSLYPEKNLRNVREIDSNQTVHPCRWAVRKAKGSSSEEVRQQAGLVCARSEDLRAKVDGKGIVVPVCSPSQTDFLRPVAAPTVGVQTDSGMDGDRRAEGGGR